MSTSPDPQRDRSSTGYLLDSALAQIREDSRLYNEAVGSYNTHLENHRNRRDLQDLPFREPITANDAFEDAMDGHPSAIEALITALIDEAHLDSDLRRHPRTYPIHLEAVEHLQVAREQLISTLEEALVHVRHTDS